MSSRNVAHKNTRADYAPIDRLLPLLSGVKQSGAGTWKAKCPAHNDKNPSLSIREKDDSAILIRCWAGCSVYEIVSAVGLELSDLFPVRIPITGNRPLTRPFPASDALRAMTSDVVFLVICAGDMQKGEKLTQDDIENLAAIGGRLRAVCNYIGVNP